jgi:hypothetical protein
MAPAIISQRPSLRAWDVSLSDRTGLALNYRCPLRRAVRKMNRSSPEIVMPVVAGNKADRLPIIIHQDTLAYAEKVDVV